MADYKKMYAILCGAIDTAIDRLEQIPQAFHEAEMLNEALLEAEELFISSADEEDLTTSGNSD